MDADPSCGYCLIMSTAFSTAALMSVAERKENVTNECNLVKLGWKSRMSVIVFNDLAIELLKLWRSYVTLVQKTHHKGKFYFF